MSGYSSLSFDEWVSKKPSMRKLQKEETLSWLNEIWHEIPSPSIKDEITQLRNVVPEVVLKEVLNGVYDGKEPEFKRTTFCLNDCFKERFPARALTWFNGFADIINWNNSTVGAENTNWVGAAMCSDYSTTEIKAVEALALANGWSWENVSKKEWERLFFLNNVSDSEMGFYQDWLLVKAKEVSPDLLTHEWDFHTENDEVKKFTPFVSSIYWLSTGSSDVNCSALSFWSENLDVLSVEDKENGLILMNQLITSTLDGNSSPKVFVKEETLDAVKKLISEIEKEKLTEKVGSCLIKPSLKAL